MRLRVSEVTYYQKRKAQNCVVFLKKPQQVNFYNTLYVW